MIARTLALLLAAGTCFAQDKRPGIGVWDTRKPSAEPLSEKELEGQNVKKLIPTFCRTLEYHQRIF